MTTRHRRPNTVIVVAVALAVALPVAIVARADPGRSPRDAEVALVQTFEADLRSGRLDAEARALVQAKLDALKQRIEADDVARRAPAAPKVFTRPIDTETPVPQPVGIFDVRVPPVSSGVATLTNGWAAEEPNGGRTTVMVGGANDPGTARPTGFGVVIVYSTVPNAAALGSSIRIRTPSAEGSVRIVAEEGRRLVLEAESGVRFLFDVDSRSFVTGGGVRPR